MAERCLVLGTLTASALQVLSGFYTLPNRPLNLVSTLNFELQFRISDNGPFRRETNQFQQDSNLYGQWTSGANIGDIFATFPPRKQYAPAPLH